MGNILIINLKMKEMKTLKMKKLSLNKETVVKLNDEMMSRINGGALKEISEQVCTLITCKNGQTTVCNK